MTFRARASVLIAVPAAVAASWALPAMSFATGTEEGVTHGHVEEDNPWIGRTRGGVLLYGRLAKPSGVGLDAWVFSEVTPWMSLEAAGQLSLWDFGRPYNFRWAQAGVGIHSSRIGHTEVEFELEPENTITNVGALTTYVDSLSRNMVGVHAGPFWFYGTHHGVTEDVEGTVMATSLGGFAGIEYHNVVNHRRWFEGYGRRESATIWDVYFDVLHAPIQEADGGAEVREDSWGGRAGFHLTFASSPGFAFDTEFGLLPGGYWHYLIGWGVGFCSRAEVPHGQPPAPRPPPR